MIARLRLPPQRVHVVHNGINLAGFGDPAPPASVPSTPVLGYFARMCKEKGLDTLMEAFIELRRRGRVPSLKLKIGGGCGPGDEPLVNQLRARLADDPGAETSLEVARD